MQIAAAYIRVSTDDQTEYSPDAQLKALTRYAEEHGMLLPKENVFMDEGISGRSADKRPAFMRMIAAAKGRDRPFDVILVHKFDRFARSREDSIVYKNLLKRDCGVSVVSITESIDDGGSGMGMLIESISEAYAEFYSINLAKEVKKGMTEKAQRGGLQSTPSFGYRVENNTLVPQPEEAEIIREIFAWYLSGCGYSEIAKRLNARGVRTHRGNPFENRTVEYILRNPVYIGKLRWTPTGRARRDFRNPDTLVVPASHEPLVSVDDWDRAQLRIAEVKAAWGYKARPTYELKDWLSGCVRCSACGTTLIFSKPHFFKCNNYVRGRCAQTQHVAVEALHEAVLARLADDMASSLPLDTRVVLSAASGGDELANTDRKLRDAARRMERLREAYLDGLEDLASYGRLKGKLEAQIKELEETASRLRDQVSPSAVSAALRESIAAAYATLTAPDASIPDKNNAFRSIVDRCTFDRPTRTLSMTYRVIF